MNTLLTFKRSRSEHQSQTRLPTKMRQDQKTGLRKQALGLAGPITCI